MKLKKVQLIVFFSNLILYNIIQFLTDRPNKCLLPPRSGDCGPGNYQSRHYWNPSKNRCAHFIYTGCNGKI
jgi:hypothetical protein